MVEAYQLYLGSVVLLSVCCLCLTPDRFTTFVQSMKTLFGSFVIQCIYAGEFGRQRPTAASHEQERDDRQRRDGSQTAARRSQEPLIVIQYSKERAEGPRAFEKQNFYLKSRFERKGRRPLLVREGLLGCLRRRN